ncbi:MAG: riboflavin biosynthesis protein RibF [Clostridia bacterium]|nr:riboflavin biosynthesis protein RibF [Clostridia bacterium]
MRIFNTLEDVKLNNNTSVALGAFDGLHLGHRKVIESVIGCGFSPSVFTFSEDPSKSLHGETEYLLTHEDKVSTLEEMGVENLFSVNFDSVKSLSSEEFFHDILMDKLHAKVIACGNDFRFGKFAKGDVKLLEKLCMENDVELKVVDPAMMNGEVISSTLIREALKNGDSLLAGKMLGRAFGFTSEVVTGNKLGRTIGIPTINQPLPEGFVKPKFGVYAVLVHIGGSTYWGVCNIGVKPTVGVYLPLAETWIGDFEGDVYGEKVKLEVFDFIRPERKFDSLEELRDEIKRNAVVARKKLKNRI